MAEANYKEKILGAFKRLGPVRRGARQMRRQWRRHFFTALRRTLPAWPGLGPAKGMFYAHDELRAGHLSGEILLTGQNIAPAPPDSLRRLAGLGQEGYQPWPVFWTRHSNARLIGHSALLLDDRKHACAEALYRIHHESDPDYHTLWLPRAQFLPGDWTSILYRWDNNYYHWLIDCLPRLALLERLPPDTKILVPAKLQPFHRETLRWLGLAERIAPPPARHLRIENYFFSAPTAMTGCANPYAVNFLREHFKPFAEAPPISAEKIYILRRNRTRGVVNEQELASFLEQRGWLAVDLEALTLAQQIGLFASARAVCGLHGAGFTNLVWCAAGCVAVELQPENFLNGCYESLAVCAGVKHRFLIQPADEQSRLRVDLDKLERLLPD